MSVTFVTYVGPAIEIKSNLFEKISYHTCKNPSCSQCDVDLNEAKFCSNCGNATIVKHIQKSTNFNAYSFINTLNEEIYDYFETIDDFPNIVIPGSGKHKRYYLCDDVDDCDIDTSLLDSMLLNFKSNKNVLEFIDVLTNTYGHDSYVIKNKIIKFSY